ncbi:MAG: hypothetical protein ACE5H0_09005, partial [Bacteroidota bacterium]
AAHTSDHPTPRCHAILKALRVINEATLMCPFGMFADGRLRISEPLRQDQFPQGPTVPLCPEGMDEVPFGASPSG